MAGGDPLSLLSGGTSLGGGAGSSLGNDQDTLQSRSAGEASLASPFTFNGGGANTPGGSVPAWIIGLGVVVFVLVMFRKKPG